MEEPVNLCLSVHHNNRMTFKFVLNSFQENNGLIVYSAVKSI